MRDDFFLFYYTIKMIFCQVVFSLSIFFKSIPHTLTICKFLIYSISMRDTFLSIEN